MSNSIPDLDSEELAAAVKTPGFDNSNDVFVLVKEFMASPDRSQAPAFVMSEQMVSAIPTLPNGTYPRVMSPVRTSELLKLAHAMEHKYNAYRAAEYIRFVARNEEVMSVPTFPWVDRKNLPGSPDAVPLAEPQLFVAQKPVWQLRVSFRT